MRWEAASLAALVAATACAPLLPAAGSPAPASPTVAARPTPRPTLTARPAQTATPVRTERPSATPVPTGPATPRPTAIVPAPRATLAQAVVNGGCSEWPDEREILSVMTQLALPPSLCLLRASPASIGRTVCTVVGCVPVTASCAERGSCVEVVDGSAPHYVLVYFRAPPTLPAQFGEGHAITRHLCKLHQERTLIDAVLRGRSWLTTLEGREFESAFAFFRSAYPAEAATWDINVSDVENYADVCTAWYYPYGRDRKVDAFQPLFQFAQKWLPR